MKTMLYFYYMHVGSEKKSSAKLERNAFKLRLHESFTLRQGWLRKVVVAVNESPLAFSASPLDLGARFGVGANMIKSMRYFAEVSGLITADFDSSAKNVQFAQASNSLSLSLSNRANLAKDEQCANHLAAIDLGASKKSGAKTSSGKDTPENKRKNPTNNKKVRGSVYLTDFALNLLKTDPHFENADTWAFLHHKIANDKNRASVFYYFFNLFDLAEFTRTDFELGYRQWLSQNGETPPDRSIKDDVGVLFNSYCNDDAQSATDDFESISHCPLETLRLLSLKNARLKTYAKVQNAKVSDFVVMQLLESTFLRENASELSLEDVFNIFKPFNFDKLYLISRLTELNAKGEIIFSRTAGLDIVRLNTNTNKVKND